MLLGLVFSAVRAVATEGLVMVFRVIPVTPETFERIIEELAGVLASLPDRSLFVAASILEVVVAFAPPNPLFCLKFSTASIALSLLDCPKVPPLVFSRCLFGSLFGRGPDQAWGRFGIDS